jgi:hypothetical protein
VGSLPIQVKERPERMSTRSHSSVPKSDFVLIEGRVETTVSSIG